MELIFLGTGSGIPSKSRNVSALALTLLQEENSVWLFDCGEATQHQIMYTSIKPGKINKIFITHLHGDHIFGLPGLLSSRSFQGGDDTLTLYGPPGLKKYVETSLKVSGTHLTYPLSVVEFSEGKIVDNNNFTVFTKKLEHGIASYGFRIVEKDKTGPLLVDKLQEQGIKPGPIYQQIKENEVVTTNDGITLHRNHFLGPAKKGRIITILGDTRSSYKFRDFAANSDLLVHEATFDHSKADLARQYFHSTAIDAAEFARDSHSKKLLLTHISSRYQKEEAQRLLQEARGVFENTMIAHDFCRVKVDSN